MKLPDITPRQQTILILLYRFRFLNRIQIQLLLGHKDYRRINAWLLDLRDKHYVEWIYSTDFYEKSKPGIYYLGLSGIHWLKLHQDHPIEEYRKRYRESERSRGFIDQSMLVADCCLTMDREQQNPSQIRKLTYRYFTQADYYDPTHTYHFLAQSELIRPQLVFETFAKHNVQSTQWTCLVEIIEDTMPRYRVRKRLKNYIEYLVDEGWQDDRPEEDRNPRIMIICPTTSELIYCKRAALRLLEDHEDEDILMWFTTIEKVKAHGMTSRIWDIVRPSVDED